MEEKPSAKARRRDRFVWPPPRAVTLILGILNFMALANPLGASVVAWALTVLGVLIVSAVGVRVAVEVLHR